MDSEMPDVIAYDTFGTTIDIDDTDVQKLNERFFELAEQGFFPELTKTDIARLREMCRANHKDPAYLSESGIYKGRMIREGKFEMPFFPDTIDFLVACTRAGIRPVTVSKGGIDIIEAAYDRPLPKETDVCGRQYRTYRELTDILSTSANFKYPDKTKPECYEELESLLAGQGKSLRGYVSDDLREVEAAYNGMDSERTGRYAVHIPVNMHRNPQNASSLEKTASGIYTAGSLMAALPLLLGKVGKV